MRGTLQNKKLSNSGQKLVKIDKYGRIYIPKVIRDFFQGYRFFVLVSDGKIILDPIKLEDGFVKGLDGNGGE